MKRPGLRPRGRRPMIATTGRAWIRRRWPWACVGIVAGALTSAPAGAYTAYVTNERDNTVSVVDLDKMATVKTVPVGQRPRGIAITADGSQILVCASDDDTIQV